MIKFVLIALVATVLIVGGYALASGALNSAPAADVPPQTAAIPQSTAVAKPDATIVKSSLNKDGIPDKIGSSALKDSILGRNALDDLSKLHGSTFDLLNGYRAQYEGAAGNATLYVGQAKDAAAATQLAQEMAGKIGDNNPMFTDLQQMSISGRTIYEVNGQGQLHFFYAVNDKIVWLATDAGLASDGLHSIWGIVK